MIVIAYHVLARDEPYRDLAADWSLRRNGEHLIRWVIAQLERLGHTVTPDAAS